MYKTIDEALKVFKAKTNSYLYGSIVLKMKSENPFQDFKLTMLEGMKQCLGLTQEEVSEIWKKTENEMWAEREKNEQERSKKDN